jgi:alpha-ribazole phosphatase
MEIYLIRHTTPLVENGICYGWADLDVTETFLQEAQIIKQHLPDSIQNIYSSPLQRCKKLAEELFANANISYQHNLKEINCGKWELQKWDDIPKHEIDPWMNDFVNVVIPDGESYVDLYSRVTNAFIEIFDKQIPAAIVAHGGVIRSILSHITQTDLVESFNKFKLHYGCVIKIYTDNTHALQYQLLSNIESKLEKHKPSQY